MVTPEGHEPDVVTVGVGRAELACIAGEMGGTDTEATLREGALDRLLTPALRATDPGDLLYLIPHESLHRIPLQAAWVDGAPLIERNPVATVPSASALHNCRAKRKGRRRSMLIVADPGGGSAPLVFAREQALAVAEQFGVYQLVSGARASREYLVAALNGHQASPDILHFTAHGVFDPHQPMRSGIELADGRLTAADILGMSLDVDLVTLGACETGLGAATAGDDIIGLAWSLFCAGTPTALVSLWRVEELSATMLLKRFYAELQAGRSKAHALQAAQLWLRRLSAAEVLAHAGTARERLGGRPDFERVITEHEAWLRLTSGDHQGALALYRALRAEPTLPAAERDRLEVLELRAGVLARGRARRPVALPFSDPRHWAPFFLTGDWL
ncbi:CHAT domain-containing protein [Streptomyces sp. SS7]|uniref:CHAT domain-containing protein n=1 Tax=Streptomyces sp. SS7 TaxID=3108485 RepID=UPI0030EF11C3